jgi:hypothetical protein
MDKFYIENCYKDLGRTLSEKDKSIVFTKPIGSALKIIQFGYLDYLGSYGLDMEDKICCAKEIDDIPEIIVPKSSVYDMNDNFVGYIMNYVSGPTYGEYNKSKIRYDKDVACDLYVYASEIGELLEEIVKRRSDVVFFDLISDSNILVCENSFKFIDYDGIQIDSFVSDRSICVRDLYVGTKYMNDYLFTKDIDIKKIIFFYFKNALDIDLSFIDFYQGDDVASFIDEKFHELGIDFDEFKDKVYRLYSDCENMYLGDSLFKFADGYELYFDNDGKRHVKKKAI